MSNLKLLYFPWDAAGSLLRTLSFQGGAGNAAAIGLYLILSLLPLAAAELLRKKKGRKREALDLWGLVLSAYTFWLLYAFVNPVLLLGRLPEALAEAGSLPFIKAVSAGLWLSILAAWLLLSLKKKLDQEEILDQKEFLLSGFRGFLLAAMLLSVLAALGEAGTAIADYVARHTQSAVWEVEITGFSQPGITPELGFLLLKVAAIVIPYGFLIGMQQALRKLLKVIGPGEFGAEAAKAAAALAAVSKNAVSASVLCDLIWNGALFLWSGALTDVSYHWEISLLPLLMAFGSLVLARYLREAAKLKYDNEMII